MKEFFVDFDPLRKGCVTHGQFVRCLVNSGLRLDNADANALAEHFTSDDPNVQKPQDVCYQKFCEAVDDVFVTQHLELTPAAEVPLPGATLSTGFAPNPVADEEECLQVLH